MPRAIIKVQNMSKTFISKERKRFLRPEKRKIQALKNINLDIYDGEIFGLLGPNGAGKTTLIKCLTTLLIPTEGTAWVNGFNLQKEENLVRASLGCMLMGERGLYWKLTGRENLEYFGALYHVPKEKRKERITYLADLLNMREFLDRTVETYSSGQKMITAFAKSLVNDAPILFLDEPTVTMDVHAARELRRIVKELNREGHTIIYTTHQMFEADELCQRVAIIDRGEIIALGTPAELKKSLRVQDVINLGGVIPKGVAEKIRAIPGVREAVIKDVKAGMSTLSVMCDNSRKILPKIMEVLLENDVQIEYIKPQDVTLEDVFIAETGRALSVDTSELSKEKKGEAGGKV
ncbi:MAG: ABC transporter ATP-binding protein [Methanomassiliicoccales archaeon]|nr:MAG: ABC transporter ATP-binding protein [Methanomassiliicoccales archaeon]